MNKILYLILLVVIITSCEKSKEYEYVEIVLKETLFDGTKRLKKMQ